MPEVLSLLAPLAAGAVLGLFFYGGLWLTVQWLPTARRPEFVAMGSFLGRTVITLAAFYLLMNGRWERLVACLIGFVALRLILTRRWRAEPHQSHKTGGGQSAPAKTEKSGRTLLQ